jgi:cytochrome P450
MNFIYNKEECVVVHCSTNGGHFVSGEPLSEKELHIMITMLLFAGHETTANLIGNGRMALVRHPDQRELLQADSTLLRSTVLELLCFDPPVQMIGRTAAEDVEFKGKVIHKGETVLVVLAAGNRDPEHFSEPDRLNIQRKEDRNVSLGYGIHYCLGSSLAQMEGQIAFGRLLQRLPTTTLASDTQAWWRPSWFCPCIGPVTYCNAAVASSSVLAL